MVHRAASKLVLFAGLLLVGGGLLISCAPDTSAPALTPRPRATSTAAGATPTAQKVLATLRAFVDQSCLECHTNKDQLVKLAVVPVVEKAESEGPG